MYVCAHAYVYVLWSPVWDLYERVFLAACDAAQMDVAEECSRALLKKFGQKSLRVRRLFGMREELHGGERLLKAEQVYDGILKEDPTHMGAWKRKVTLFKSVGDITGAIAELNQYVYMCSGRVCIAVGMGCYIQTCFFSALPSTFAS